MRSTSHISLLVMQHLLRASSWTIVKPHLDIGLFQGEYGSHGVVMHSAVSASASTSRPHIRVRGPQAVTWPRQADALAWQLPPAAASHSRASRHILVVGGC